MCWMERRTVMKGSAVNQKATSHTPHTTTTRERGGGGQHLFVQHAGARPNLHDNLSWRRLQGDGDSLLWRCKERAVEVAAQRRSRRIGNRCDTPDMQFCGTLTHVDTFFDPRTLLCSVDAEPTHVHLEAIEHEGALAVAATIILEWRGNEEDVIGFVGSRGDAMEMTCIAELNRIQLAMSCRREKNGIGRRERCILITKNHDVLTRSCRFGDQMD